MKRIIAAAFFAAFASAAFAQKAVEPIGRYVLVEEGQTPPFGYAPHVPTTNGRTAVSCATAGCT